MQKLGRADLHPLEKYAEMRAEFRDKVMRHKSARRLPLDADATLYFEDRLTVQYQVQEMLRAERIFEAAGIEEELAAYNPLIPDGRNWKATLMIEIDDPVRRRKRLAELVGVENRVWMQVEGLDKIRPIADEDLERATEDKTSSVHFLRFELSDGMVERLKQGAKLSAGIDHAACTVTVDPVPAEIRKSLMADLD